MQVFWLDDVITLNRLHGHVVEALAAASACSAFDTMELAGADDKDGKPDSGELSGESESNAATIFYRINESSPTSANSAELVCISLGYTKSSHLARTS